MWIQSSVGKLHSPASVTAPEAYGVTSGLQPQPCPAWPPGHWAWSDLWADILTQPQPISTPKILPLVALTKPKRNSHSRGVTQWESQPGLPYTIPIPIPRELGLPPGFPAFWLGWWGGLWLWDPAPRVTPLLLAFAVPWCTWCPVFQTTPCHAFSYYEKLIHRSLRLNGPWRASMIPPLWFFMESTRLPFKEALCLRILQSMGSVPVLQRRTEVLELVLNAVLRISQSSPAMELSMS